MSLLRRFLSRKWLLFGLIVVVIAAVPMLHPYPRQSLFGPTIRGKPWCVWEAEVRHYVRQTEFPRALEESFSTKLMRWMGVKHDGMPRDALFDHEEMLPLLLKLAEDEDPTVRWMVLDLIGVFPKLHDPLANSILRRRLQDDVTGVRFAAGRTLWRISREKQVFQMIFAELDNPESRAREDAMSSFFLIYNDAPEFLPRLLAYANDPSDSIRRDVMFAMPDLGAEGIPVLIQGLDDPATEVRTHAANSLISFGPVAKEAVPTLIRRLNDSDSEVQRNVITALKAIDPDRFRDLKRDDKRKATLTPA